MPRTTARTARQRARLPAAIAPATECQHMRQGSGILAPPVDPGTSADCQHLRQGRGILAPPLDRGTSAASATFLATGRSNAP